MYQYASYVHTFPYAPWAGPGTASSGLFKLGLGASASRKAPRAGLLIHLRVSDTSIVATQ